MKTRSIGVLGASSLATAASMFVASGANADFIGWTSTTRAVTGGYLINVFAATNNSTDVILNVSGGSVGLPTEGFIRTTSAGGFRQGSGTQSVFAPAGAQNWTTLDSFLTVGGGFVATNNNAWTGNSGTQGDPPWNVTYFDTDLGENVTVNSFNIQSNEAGFTNPNTNTIPGTAGWFLAGSSSPARSLATLASIRNAYTTVGGVNFGASSAAAAAATHGYMVAQLFVTDLDLTWKMSATLRRSDSTTSNASFQFAIVPAPGALALLGIAGITSRRRRA